MSWDNGYQSPEEQALADRERAEAQQRARMTPFERRLLDYLGEISASLTRLADHSEPFYDLDAATGELKVHHGNAEEIKNVLKGTNTSIAAGDGSDGSAEPVPPPGSAHPNPQ